jgi:hypothetical protein
MGLAGSSGRERPTYHVIAERAGASWFISVPAVPGALTRTRLHDEIEPIARAAIARELDVPEDSFDVDISSSGTTDR